MNNWRVFLAYNITFKKRSNISFSRTIVLVTEGGLSIGSNSLTPNLDAITPIVRIISSLFDVEGKFLNSLSREIMILRVSGLTF